MASSWRTKLRIAASVLFATGFWDAISGRFLFEPICQSASPSTPQEEPPADADWRDLSGALHVHSNYSDGAGDVPTVMEAARASGVDFVLLTDHNSHKPLRDGWEAKYADQTPFLLIGTEVTVEHGAFLLALEMPPAWEPTQRQPPQVAIDEVRALNGLPFVSLPFDVKHPWRDWDAHGFDGLEVVNVSTIARRHINVLSLVWLLPLNKWRGTMATLRALIARPDAALARWDRLLSALPRRRMVGIGALDAHALMKIGSKKHPIPSYEDSFRIATTHVLIAPAAADEPNTRRMAVHDALRQGRCYIAFDCLGDPTFASFIATEKAESSLPPIPMGQAARTGARLSARFAADGSSARILLRLYCDGRIVAAGDNGALDFVADAPGAYRVEAFRYGARFGALFVNARLWVLTNPLYIGDPI